MPELPLRLAIAQCLSTPGDVAANAAASARTVVAARERGAELVVFPELSLTGYDLPLLEATPAAWVTRDDARLDPVRRACADSGVTAVLGAPMRAGAENRIAALIIDGGGAVHVSDKVHVHASEAHLFAPGEAAPPFELHGWKVAVAICFDAARPRHADEAAGRGAELYLVSALYVVGEERRVDLHLGARAMDHRMFAVLANHAGRPGGHVSIGGSGVWRPDGSVQVREPSADEALLVAELDPAAVNAYR